jgi:histidinol-phosphate aminotransferase
MGNLTRRGFGRMTSLLAAGAALPFYSETALAQLSMLGPLPPDAVKINANENPMGPCKEAAEAIRAAVLDGGRYQYDETFKLAATLADVEQVSPQSVIPYAGSSDPLHRAVLAFTSPSKALVVADPGYEAGPRAAAVSGAQVIKVPLTKDYRHDVKAMAAASPNPGLIYVCNPNNPTGTVTPKEDIEWLVANKPAGSVVLLDEAYIHLSHSAVRATYLVAQDKDLIILRTFSKLYGMAGIRAGAAIGRPDLVEKLRAYGSGPLPVAGMAGATASLKAANVVAERRKIIRDTREDLFGWLDRKNFAFVPSETNCFMIDTKRPGQEVIRALADEKVYIGRVWPVWPTHVRVSVGTREEMAKFKDAFGKVMA